MDKEKKIKRGYNQTELITQIISKELEILEGKNIVFKLKGTNTGGLLANFHHIICFSPFSFHDTSIPSKRKAPARR